MKKSSSTLRIALAVTAALSFSLKAGPLKKAEVTQIINEVGIIQPGQGERPAAVNDVVEGKLGVRTGQKSRAELVFSDETLTRLGANTIFNFEDGSRSMDLHQGTLLLQVPKNAGGATIRTAAVTAAVTGTTILFEHTPAPVVSDKLKQSESKRHRNPHGYIKAMVLEGHLKVWLKGKLGESILLGPGQMLIMADDATLIPEPVDFDVETVVSTSKLIDNSQWVGRKRRLELPLITREIQEQRKRKHTGDLLETNLFINGRGTTVVIADTEEKRENQRDSQPTVTPGLIPEPSQTPSPTPPIAPRPTPPIPPKPTPRENDLGTFTFSGSTDIFGTDAIANFDPTLPGNARTVQALIDTTAGGTNVLPTSGRTFGVLSTGGTAPNGYPYTGTQGITQIKLPTTKAVTSDNRSFLEFDYRFLTNEIGRGSGNNDRVTFAITGVNGMSVEYVISRDQLQEFGESLTPIARSNVGGFLAGTDWLTLKLEVTPFLKAGNTTFTIAIVDYESNDGDSALAIDRYQITKESLVAPNSDLIGTYTARFPSGVTFGEGKGEYRAPSLRGRENTAEFGPGSSGGSFFASTSTGDLVVNMPIVADAGPTKQNRNSESSFLGGEGGTVDLSAGSASVNVNSPIQVASNDSETGRLNVSGGTINVTSARTGGTGVTISNTGELLSLLNASAPGPGGKISIRADDSNVLISGGKVIATGGTVDIRSPGANRQITLTNAQIRGDVVKIGALGNNGQLLIGGGQISADTTLKLYGNSSNGSIVFVGNTELGGSNAQSIISAYTVTVRNGVSVQVNGPAASVYTTNPNYSGSGGNGSTTGVFTGGGANTFSPSGTPSATPPPFD